MRLTNVLTNRESKILILLKGITYKSYISIAFPHHYQDISVSLQHFLHIQVLLVTFYQIEYYSNSFLLTQVFHHKLNWVIHHTKQVLFQLGLEYISQGKSHNMASGGQFHRFLHLIVI
jgi:hypothetical protein